MSLLLQRKRRLPHPRKGNLSLPHPVVRVQTFLHRLGSRVGDEYWNGLLDLHARGLVYTTLVSLVPFLAVVFSVLKAFGVQQQIEPFLAQALASLGSQGEVVTGQLVEFVNNLQVGVLGMLGLVGLLFTAFSVLGQIEGALHYLWRVRHARSLTRKFSTYVSLALLGPVLIFTAFVFTAAAQSHWLMQLMLQLSYLDSLVVVLTQVMPFVFLCTAFTFLYKLLLDTQINFDSALVGGVTAGLLWHVVGAGFAAFVVNSVYYTAVYSSFAILMVFLIWLYVGWVIVLVGGEAAYIYQHPPGTAPWRALYQSTTDKP